MLFLIMQLCNEDRIFDRIGLTDYITTYMNKYFFLEISRKLHKNYTGVAFNFNTSDANWF